MCFIKGYRVVVEWPWYGIVNKFHILSTWLSKLSQALQEAGFKRQALQLLSLIGMGTDTNQGLFYLITTTLKLYLLAV